MEKRNSKGSIRYGRRWKKKDKRKERDNCRVRGRMGV